MTGWPTETRAALLQKLSQAAEEQDKAHEVLREMPFQTMVHAVLSHIQARPDATSDALAVFVRKLNAMQWELERREGDE